MIEPATFKKSAMAGNIPLRPSPSSESPLCVLVVDDEMLIRWSVSEALLLSGHRVLEAASAKGALEAIASAQESIDVVLLDHRLPDSTGLGLLQKIRETLPRSAVVLMTAYGTPDVTRDALSLGVFRVLDKPFDMGDVDSLVRGAHAAIQH